MRYGSCDREWDRIFSHFGPFCPFAPLTIQIITILKKQKKHLEMLSFYTCVPKIKIMMYTSWNMECDRQYTLSFWAIFCPFTPITTWKIKTSKKTKQNLEISSFYTCVPQITFIWCMVPEIWSMTEFFVILGYSFTFTPLITWKIKILKIILEISSFYTCVPQMTIIWCIVPGTWNVRQNFLSFWTIFCPFTPLTTQKIKILKKKKETPG